jgi:hypothetical protein
MIVIWDNMKSRTCKHISNEISEFLCTKSLYLHRFGRVEKILNRYGCGHDAAFFLLGEWRATQYNEKHSSRNVPCVQ